MVEDVVEVEEGEEAGCMNILQTEIQVEDEEGFLHVEMEEMIKIEMISHLQLEEISDWNCPPNQLDLQIGAVYHPHLQHFLMERLVYQQNLVKTYQIK